MAGEVDEGDELAGGLADLLCGGVRRVVHSLPRGVEPGFVLFYLFYLFIYFPPQDLVADGAGAAGLDLVEVAEHVEPTRAPAVVQLPLVRVRG